MKETMRAAVLRGYHEPLQIEEKLIPVPGPGEVLVKVRASGLCVSDIHIQDGKIGTVHLPYTPGHEMAGVIVAVGKGVDPARIGEHISAAIDIVCGECEFCRTGRTNLCRSLVRIGFERDGSHEEYCVIPAKNAFTVDPTIPFEEITGIPDAVGCMYNGLKNQIGYEPDGTMQIEADFNTAGTDPCHVEIAPNGAFVSVANFASGAVTIFPRDAQGDLQADKTIFQHEGSSVHPIRQKGPHAHSSLFAPDCRLMFVPDLGMDKVVAYRYDGASVCVDEDATITVERGCGPRYGEFAPNGKDFYLINEIGSRVMHYRYNAGKMTLCEETSTLPYGFTGENICSDLHITADGKFLYASNRGHDSITAYHILEDGSLAWIECRSSGGKTPRNFALDRTGRYLLAENQDSDNITVFAIGEDGRLTKQESYAFGSPVCIRFFKKTAF